MSRRDLFVVVADLDAENVIKTLLSTRKKALGVAVDFDPDTDFLRYNKRDSGCYQDAVSVLTPPRRTHEHALIIFDRHGCGAESADRKAIEDDVERRLRGSGWPAGMAAAVVIDPELEAWVWSTSPHVANVLGWGEHRNRLRPFLADARLWDAQTHKPTQPKEAVRSAVRHKRARFTAASFADLAENVSVDGCHDEAFCKLCETLVRWFGTAGSGTDSGEPELPDPDTRSTDSSSG